MSSKDERQLESPREPTKIWNKTFVSIFLSNMVMWLGQMMSNALLPVYAESLGATPTIIGALVSSFAITAIVLRIIAAPAIDSYNKKYIAIGSILVFAVAYLGFGISRSIPSLIVFRLVQGLGQAFASVCFLTIVADVLPKDKYGTGIGYFSVAQVVSQAIGPSIGLWLVGLVGYNATFLINMGIMLLAAILALQIDLPYKRMKKMEISLSNVIAKEAIMPMAVTFFVMIAFAIVQSFLIVFASQQGVGSEIGIYFMVTAVTMVFTRPAIGRMVDKYGLVKVLIPGLFCDVVAFIIISFAHTLMTFLVAGFISAFGFGACLPALQALVMKTVTKERRGAGSCTNAIGMDLGTLTYTDFRGHGSIRQEEVRGSRERSKVIQ